MKLLFITHRLPYPPHKGEKIRALNILKFLAARHTVHLASLAEDSHDLQHLAALQTYARSVTVERVHPRLRRLQSLSALWSGEAVSSRYFHSNALQRRVDALIEREGIEGIFCSSSPTGEYVFRSRHRTWLGRLPKIMDLIDVDSAKWREFASRSGIGSAWLYRREACHLERLEQRLGREFDQLLVVSEVERKYLDAPAAARTQVVANGVDLEYFAPGQGRPVQTDGAALVFTGVMDYRPNVEGIEWFVQRVLPRVRARCPQVTLYVVGLHPNRAVRRLARLPGIVVTGFVPDVRDYVAQGICIAPLWIARGIQNKVLEAMAMGRPIVLTPPALEGIDAQPDRDVLLARDAEAFADKTLQLLQDPQRAEALGAAARQQAKKRYAWETILRGLGDLPYGVPGTVRNVEPHPEHLVLDGVPPVSRAL
jgi:sugar transferase (PEP-CTERM/EpsH1 system associated)